jgi:hypothetical protein
VRIRQRRQRRFADDEALAGTDLTGAVKTVFFTSLMTVRASRLECLSLAREY